jgi:hypothetical protein
MAPAIVARIRQRVGSEVPMTEILAAIKKIAPSRLSTDTIVVRLQKATTTKPVRSTRDDEDEMDEPEESDEAPAPRKAAPKRRTGTPTSTQGQISALLDRNWTHARESGLKPPELSTDRFVRTAQSAVGEPKPTVARVLEAVQKLSKRDVLITPNLVADEIIETDEL